jgi:hypothetical protein
MVIDNIFYSFKVFVIYHDLYLEGLDDQPTIV